MTALLLSNSREWCIDTCGEGSCMRIIHEHRRRVTFCSSATVFLNTFFRIRAPVGVASPTLDKGTLVSLHSTCYSPPSLYHHLACAASPLTLAVIIAWRSFVMDEIPVCLLSRLPSPSAICLLVMQIYASHAGLQQKGS